MSRALLTAAALAATAAMGSPGALAVDAASAAAFVTCAQANAMPAEERRALGLQFADRAARFYGARIAEGEQVGVQIGWLVRSACTIAPEAYLSTVVARAVRVMGGGEEPPVRLPLDMSEAMFLTCRGVDALPAEQSRAAGEFIGAEAAAHYGLTLSPQWTPDYVAALVHNGCKMYPDAYYLAMIGRAVRAVSAPPAAAAASQPAR